MGPRVIALGLLASACGRVAFEPRPGDASEIDANATGPFGPPQPIPSLATTAVEQEASITADLLEIYVRIGMGSVGDLHVSKRGSVTEAFPPPVAVAELNTTDLEAAPGIGPDGLTVWFESDRPGGLGGVDIYTSTRPTRDAPWSTPTLVTEVSTAGADYTPAISPDQLSLTVVQGSPRHIYLYTRASTSDVWTGGTSIEELDSSLLEGRAPMASSYELVFSRRLNGNNVDLWSARRTTEGGTYTTIEPLDEVNTDDIEFDPWITPGGHTLLFGSDRAGTQDIYMATR